MASNDTNPNKEIVDTKSPGWDSLVFWYKNFVDLSEILYHTSPLVECQLFAHFGRYRAPIHQGPPLYRKQELELVGFGLYLHSRYSLT